MRGSGSGTIRDYARQQLRKAGWDLDTIDAVPSDREQDRRLVAARRQGKPDPAYVELRVETGRGHRLECYIDGQHLETSDPLRAIDLFPAGAVHREDGEVFRLTFKAGPDGNVWVVGGGQEERIYARDFLRAVLGRIEEGEIPGSEWTFLALEAEVVR